MIIYFTGTGNSRFIADALADRLNDECICVSDYIKSGRKGVFHSDNPWIFAFPIYLSTIPEIFVDFLMKSEFSGSDRAYFAGTCAGSVGAASIDAQKICEAKKLEYKGIKQIIMPQNYIALFKMTEKAECELRYENALKTADEMASLIKSDNTLDMATPSKFEYIATKLVEKMYNGPFTKTKNFYVTDGCVGCGLCEKKCPLNKIEMKDNKPSWSGSCIHCMACINNCPKAAIEYGKKTKDKPRYVCRKYKKRHSL